jgi:hypothetical protein
VYVPAEEPSEEGVASRHKDNRLQTRLLAEPLQKRLLTLQRDSALFEEEQGVNILFLAVGFIKWFEADSSGVERADAAKAAHKSDVDTDREAREAIKIEREALGFAATSAQLRAVVAERARHLVAAATITETHGLLRLVGGA